MKLLVTNDDGIDSPFLHELVHALVRAKLDINVVAPVTEQSWTGASKTRAKPVRSAQVDRGFGCPTWMVDGTPSDCVNIALAHLVRAAPDAVVSGINLGFNASLGFNLHNGLEISTFVKNLTNSKGQLSANTLNNVFFASAAVPVMIDQPLTGGVSVKFSWGGR